MADTEMLQMVISRLSEGFLVTLKIFFETLIIALPAGLVLSFGSMSKFKPLKYLVRILVWVIRGTPLVLQLIVIFYGPGLIASMAQEYMWEQIAQGIMPNDFIIWLSTWECLERSVAVIVAFSLNYACYFSEIFRGGIESISKGQYEACQVLGMTKTQTFFKVVLMQVIKRIIPPMSNEIITLVKDTSLARVISVYELIWAGEVFIKLNGLLWPLLTTGIFYLIFNGLLTVLFGKLEKKLNYYQT